MRVRLKGLNYARVKLAGGRRVTYWYAWRGGPRLQGEPGTPEFIASYNAAVAAKVAPQAGTMMELLRYFEGTTEFTELAERTQEDYREKITLIEKEFGDLPLAALPDPRTRGDFKDWRDALAKKSKRQADYAWTVLARVLSVAKDRGRIAVNPCEKGGRLYGGNRRDRVWSDEDEAAYLAAAPAYMRLPILLAIWTGQRQGDLLALPWTAYDGTTIRLRQSKTGRRVEIPVGAPLKASLDAAKRERPGTATTILVNTDGLPWTGNGFRTAWRRACKKAGISGLTFHDLRGTAVTRLALSNATEAEMAYITALPLSEVRSILDAHYLSRDPALGRSAIAKLEARVKREHGSQNGSQSGPGGSSSVPGKTQ